MTQEEIEQLVLDAVTMIEDPNGKCIHSYSYEELAEDIAQRLVKKLTIPAVVSRFYAVFSDYGTDFSQRSIWFDDINKAIEVKKEMIGRKGKFIILEKSGENAI